MVGAASIYETQKCLRSAGTAAMAIAVGLGVIVGSRLVGGFYGGSNGLWNGLKESGRGS